MLSRNHLLSGMFALLACASAAWAQASVNPLEYEYEHPRIGADFGISSVWQTGVFTAGCGVFQTASMLNPVFAAAYDKPIGGRFRFEALLGYQGRSVTGTYNSTESIVLTTNNGPVRVKDVDFQNVGNATFSYVFFLPSIKYYLTKGLFAGAGINSGLLVTKRSQYTKNIISKTVKLGDLGISTVAYSESESSDPYSKVFPTEEIPSTTSFSADAALYIGAEFAISKWKKLKLAPRLLYTIPLTTVTTAPNDLRLNTLQFLIGVRYDLF